MPTRSSPTKVARQDKPRSTRPPGTTRVEKNHLRARELDFSSVDPTWELSEMPEDVQRATQIEQAFHASLEGQDLLAEGAEWDEFFNQEDLIEYFA